MESDQKFTPFEFVDCGSSDQNSEPVVGLDDGDDWYNPLMCEPVDNQRQELRMHELNPGNCTEIKREDEPHPADQNLQRQFEEKSAFFENPSKEPVEQTHLVGNRLKIVPTERLCERNFLNNMEHQSHLRSLLHDSYLRESEGATLPNAVFGTPYTDLRTIAGDRLSFPYFITGSYVPTWGGPYNSMSIQAPGKNSELSNHVLSVKTKKAQQDGSRIQTTPEDFNNRSSFQTNRHENRNPNVIQESRHSLNVRCGSCSGSFVTTWEDPGRSIYGGASHESECQRLLTCQRCYYSTWIPKDFHTHISKHWGEAYMERWKFKCKKCQARFISRVSLRYHVLAHEKVTKRLGCPLCRARFNNQILAMLHLREVHGLSKTFKLECIDSMFTDAGLTTLGGKRVESPVHHHTHESAQKK